MDDVLTRILAVKAGELAAARAAVSPAEMERRVQAAPISWVHCAPGWTPGQRR
jgi:hypothetical protein